MLVLGQIARNWWVFLLRGIVAILFGVLAFLRPGITLEALVLLFAFWALFDGVFSLIGSVGAAEAREPRWHPDPSIPGRHRAGASLRDRLLVDPPRHH